MLGIAEYEALRVRPRQNAAMLQSWRHLSFLHMRVPPDQIQKTLPAGLTVDTYPDENGTEWAYLGLVPFQMINIRLTGMPAAPWLSAFPETNVRTYVHCGERKPGVWFYSLEAARLLACRYARIFFALPYFWAAMRLDASADRVGYRSRRVLDRSVAADIVVRPVGEVAPSQAGSLEFFLAERYVLYAQTRTGLATGQVAHAPYPLQAASIERCQTTLLSASGFADPKSWDHVLFSPGVDVEVFSLEKVG